MRPPTPLLDLVFFDLDDTLYSTTEFARRARRRAVRAMIEQGLVAGEEEAYQELTEVVAEFSSNYDQHLDRLLDRLGPSCVGDRNPAVIIAAGVVAYHRTKEREMEVLPDARALLVALNTAGVRCGVISAGLQVKQAEKLVRLRVLPFFDPRAIFFSDQMGVSKPNPKIYAKACQSLDLQPGRTLYVGDRPTHDVDPAGRIGMKTVLYRGAGGKHAAHAGATTPDHDVADLTALIPILAECYGLPM